MMIVLLIMNVILTGTWIEKELNNQSLASREKELNEIEENCATAYNISVAFNNGQVPPAALHVMLFSSYFFSF